MDKTTRPVKVIIFAGGVGTRMWPMSRKNHPKQFQELVGDQSMFQSTVKRILSEFAPDDVFISTGKEYTRYVKKQAPTIPIQNIIAEPVRRDTLGAVGLANLFVHHQFPDAIVVAIWGADHIVKDTKEFDKAIKAAAKYSAETNKLVKLDVKPTFASIHNGWVKLGHKLETKHDYKIYEFLRFIEKPNEAKAKKLFNSRKYLINTGYLVWPAALMHQLFKEHQPHAYKLLEEIKLHIGKSDQDQAIAQLYPSFEKTSIDYGIFEHLCNKNTVIIPVDIGWTDVGTWELLYEGIADNPRKDNLTKGMVELVDTKRSIVYSTQADKVTAVIGLDGIIIVDTKDGLVVCAMNESDKIKKLVDKMKDDNKTVKYI